MKILTLNIHSHDREFDAAVLESSMKVLADFIHSQEIDLIALQEASQEMEQPPVGSLLPMHFKKDPFSGELRTGNAALVLAEHLEALGAMFWWTWTGVKLGYERFEEGLALFSRRKITETESFWISGIRDFRNWKSRKALTARIRLDQEEALACSVHMGWWNDPEEAFQGQMERLHAALDDRCQVYLMGDFNSPAGKKDEGWQMTRSLGWLDSYDLATTRDEGITVSGRIDGWREGDGEGMRLDYIWLKKNEPVRSSRVVFNGKTGPVISDHYGVLIETE